MVEDIQDILHDSEIIVIGNKSEEFADVLESLREEQSVIDLVRISDMIKTRARYEGICWPAKKTS